MSNKLNKAISIALCATLTLAPPAIAVSILPFVAPPSKNSLMDQEDRTWDLANEMDKSIRLKGAILNMPDVNNYLQRIMDRLYPEFSSVLRVKAIDDPIMNAFCMANGKVYIHLGMLGRAQNESQLATILAHEGAHFIHRHSYQSQQAAESSSAFILGATILFGNLGQLVGGLIGVSSIFGFSRDMEREADRIGFARLAKAGYNVGESPKIFETLSVVAKLEDKTPLYMFASHPRLQERIESFKELIKAQPEQSAENPLDEMDFVKLIVPLREVWLKREVGQARYKFVIHLLSRDENASEWPAHYKFYLGEAYRLQNEKDDAENAIVAYRAALMAAADYAPAYRELGTALYKKKDPAANELLQKYLTLAPEASDRQFVEQLIEVTK